MTTDKVEYNHQPRANSQLATLPSRNGMNTNNSYNHKSNQKVYPKMMIVNTTHMSGQVKNINRLST